MQQKETIGKKCAVHELFASKERLVSTVKPRGKNLLFELLLLWKLCEITDGLQYFETNSSIFSNHCRFSDVFVFFICSI